MGELIDLQKVIDEREAFRGEPLVLYPDDEARVMGHHVRVTHLLPSELQPGMIILQPGGAVPVALLTKVFKEDMPLKTIDHILTDITPSALWRLQFEAPKGGGYTGVLREDQEMMVVKERVHA